jgi:hypothetical protein
MRGLGEPEIAAILTKFMRIYSGRRWAMAAVQRRETVSLARQAAASTSLSGVVGRFAVQAVAPVSAPAIEVRTACTSSIRRKVKP